MAAAEQVTDSVSYHGEGAVWHPGWGGLKTVDMLAGTILSLDEATGTVTRQEVGSPVAAAVRPRASGPRRTAGAEPDPEPVRRPR